MDNKKIDVAFFGVNEKQIKVITNTKKTTQATTLEDKVKHDVKVAIKNVLIKHGAKPYQFETLETNGKDEEQNQLYKRVQMTKVSIPIETTSNNVKGFKMFYIDTWNKTKLTSDYQEDKS